MPYKSEAQRRFFNSPAGKAKIGKEEVEHWNEVSKGKELPEKAEDNKSGFNASMHNYNNEVAKGNLDKAKSLLEAATKEFETYEDKSTKKAAKIELNNKRRTHGMKAIDKAIRACDSMFNKGDLVKIGGQIYKIIGVREKEKKYDLRGILGGGSIYSFDVVESRGTKLSSFPKGIFTDQWGSKWEITPNDSESYNAKNVKTGERKVFKNDWLRHGGRVEWK